MKYSESNKPLVCMQTNSTCYKGTEEFVPKGILWHSTGANNTWLKRYVQPSDDASDREEMLKILGVNKYGNDWNHTKVLAGLNAWIGKLANGTVATVQTMPWNYRPWGCGAGSKGSCNNSHIQFEICEDGLTDKNYFNKVYTEACELTAYLCKLYKIDPHGTVVVDGVEVPTILCHADSYKLGLGSNHSDVLKWFKKHGKTMDDVRNDVAALLGQPQNSPSSQELQFKVGDIVNFTGNLHYKNSATSSGSACKSGEAKVTAIAQNAKHPYHLVRVSGGTSTVYGWVDAKDVESIDNKSETKKSILQIAKEVLAGKWGNGSARKQKLENAGYDYSDVQEAVNDLVNENTKTVEDIAKEVIKGKWGNGATRKKKIEAIGYDYNEVQEKVNELLRR